MSDLMQILTEKPQSELAVKIWKSKLYDSLQALPVKRVTDIVKLNEQYERSLAAISKKHGEGTVKAFLVLALGDFLRFFSVGNTMDERQVAQTVMLILEDHRHLTIEDFKVFFNNCKKGLYGTSYNRIDGQVILEWLGKYEDERAAAFVEQNEIEAFSQKDRYVRRGEVQKICDRELNRILGNLKRP